MNYRITIASGALASLFALAGCASTSYSRTGDYHPNPREATCEYAVYTVTPSRPFKEIGAIEFMPGHTYTINEIKDTARHDVCKAGGNGLILAPPGEGGYYKSATVIWIDN